METPNIEQLQKDIEKIKALVDDPQEGLFTWWGALKDALIQIRKTSNISSPLELFIKEYPVSVKCGNHRINFDRSTGLWQCLDMHELGNLVVIEESQDIEDIINYMKENY